MQVQSTNTNATFELTLTGPHARLVREEALECLGRAWFAASGAVSASWAYEHQALFPQVGVGVVSCTFGPPFAGAQSNKKKTSFCRQADAHLTTPMGRLLRPAMSARTAAMALRTS
jgi:hypothetical protein